MCLITEILVNRNGLRPRHQPAFFAIRAHVVDSLTHSPIARGGAQGASSRARTSARLLSVALDMTNHLFSP